MTNRSNFTERTRKECLEKQNYKCDICGHTLTDSNGRELINFHHKHPCSEGGSNDLRNCVALCPNCHSGIHAMEHRYGKHLSYDTYKSYWMDTDEFENYTGSRYICNTPRQTISYSTHGSSYTPKSTGNDLEEILVESPRDFGKKLLRIKHIKNKYQSFICWFVGFVTSLFIIFSIGLIVFYFLYYTLTGELP